MSAYSVSGQELTLDRLYGSPNINGEVLQMMKVSPDGKRITFLKGTARDARILDLWEYNVAERSSRLLVASKDLVASDQLSEEEKSRRERQRIQDSGIVDYIWDLEGKALTFQLGGDVYYKPVAGHARRLTTTTDFETDIKASPKGKYVSFIRNQNPFAIDVATGKEKQLTFDGAGAISNGVAEFVAQEEMDRFTGYWWSPDDNFIAFTRIDETPVQILERYEIAADGSVTTIRQRYPLAGTPNVLIQLAVVQVESGKITWIDLGPEKDIYLARVDWLWDSRRISFQRQTRDQKKLDLVFVDIETGLQTNAITEESPTWINLSKDLIFLKESKRFLWTSERSGYRHINLYENDGKLIRAVTSGNWKVHEIRGVDEKAGIVYFEALADTPMEIHLYSAPLAGGEIRNLTKSPGTHRTEVSVPGKFFVDNYSSSSEPPRVALRDLHGETMAVILANALDENHPYHPYLADHANREYDTLKADDGTLLYYSVMKPPHSAAGKKYPAIVGVYGGPTGQEVSNKWLLNFDQYLARNGYVVFRIDNRGSANRGKSFEDVLYRDMGDIEIQDQLRGVEFLKSLPFVDADRVGVYGWSYGGYMVLHMLLKAPDAFRAGFSGAPVTDWRLYDTHYTERYMGDPKKEDGAYTRSSVYPYLQYLKSSLLLIHGMADDNVFFDHSVRLIAELEKHGRLFEMMTYPGQRHGIYGREQGIHRWKTIFDFFERRLKRSDE